MSLADIDWDGEWKRVQTTRSAAYTPSFWDSRAPSYREKERDDYHHRFLEYLHIKDGWTILDVGSGSGTFSIPLALEGHHVTAMDFSRGMLDQLLNEARKDGIENLITVIEGGWDDDWHALGLRPGCVDVAIASRSFLTLELSASLRKLNEAAKRRVCLTMGVMAFPSYDVRMIEAIGHEPRIVGDYFLALGALASMGIIAEMRLLGTAKRDVFPNREAAKASLGPSLGTITAEEEELLDRYLDEHLIPWQLTKEEHARFASHQGHNTAAQAATDQSGNSEDERWGVAKDYLRDVRWAFISWDKEEET